MADDVPDLRDITSNFYKEVVSKNHDIFLSDLVITEIDRTRDENKRRELHANINHFRPFLLSSNQEVAFFADLLVKRGVIPIKYRDDALHIGYAVVNELDILVSWNLTHIVKLKTKVRVNALAALEGYKGILISTPEEVIGYD